MNKLSFEEESHDNICMSGGAKGADTIFGNHADACGHTVRHWSFDHHHCAAGPKHQVILSYRQLCEADPHLRKANEIVFRAFPSRSEYVNNLLRRNYYQVVFSDNVYAVVRIGEKGIPNGGTAWALAMAVQRKNIPNVYVFDVEVNEWKEYDKAAAGLKWEWKPISRPTRPSGIYAGIGMSKITEEGDQEIGKLYNQVTQ